MIDVKGENIEEVVSKAIMAVFESCDTVSDLEIERESAAVISLCYLNGVIPAISVKDSIFIRNNDVGLSKVLVNDNSGTELSYWRDQVIDGMMVERFIDHLSRYPYSRRALIDLWRDSDFSRLEEGAACITQIYFRIKGGKLEMHTHARANDVINCLLFDLQIMQYIHTSVASGLNLIVGEHIHFVDALHLYKKDKDKIQEIIKSGFLSEGYSKI